MRDEKAASDVKKSRRLPGRSLVYKESIMSRRLTNREKLLTKLNNFSESEIGEILKYAQTLEKTLERRLERPPAPALAPALDRPSERIGYGDSVTEAIPQTEDELLIMLSAARENRRARQVFEWESVRRKVEGKGSVHWRH
ncbi:MAG TPA: hypothetical protein VI479_15315 [Blastocatellia bacterium]